MFTYYRMSFKQFSFWFFVWSIFGVILARTEIADSARGGFTGFSWEPWVWAFSASYSYALVTPIIVYFCQKWSIDKNHQYKTALKLILLYLPITLVFISLMLGMRELIYWFFLGRPHDMGPLLTRYIYEFPKSLGLYTVVAFITYTRYYQQQVQQEQINAAKLHGELLSARLDVLQHQLQPHFLFNTLNLISGTMYQDVDKADSILSRLANLLRYSLATQQKPFVSLQQELDAMKSYLEIAQLRFGDRLTTNYEIAADALPVMIPVMLLQPLLENAVKYGIEPSDNGGTILVQAEVENNNLVIKIINSIHQQANKNISFGIGLENARKRLTYLYQDKASLKLNEIADNRVELIIILPREQLSNASTV